MLHYTLPFTLPGNKQHPVAQGGELGGCCTPQVPVPVLCGSGTRRWADSHPTHQPLPSQPSARESCWGLLYQGEAAAACKLLSPCLCPPRAQEGFTLSPPLCGVRRQGVNRGTSRGKAVKRNIAAMGIVKRGLTWAELHG